MRKKGLYEPLVDGIDNLMRMVLATIEGLEERMLEVEQRLGIERRCVDDGTTTVDDGKRRPAQGPLFTPPVIVIKEGHRDEAMAHLKALQDYAKQIDKPFKVDMDKGPEHAVLDALVRLDELLDGDFEYELKGPVPEVVMAFYNWCKEYTHTEKPRELVTGEA